MATLKSIKLKPGSMKGPVYADDYSRSYSCVFTLVLNQSLWVGTDSLRIAARLQESSVLIKSLVEGANGQLPEIGEPYPSANFDAPADPGAICKSITPREIGDGGDTWEVTCEWSSKLSKNAQDANQGSGGGDNQDPVGRVAEISWSSVVVEEAVFEDLLNAPLVLPNGRPYDPGLVVERTRLILTASVNKNSLLATDFSIFGKYNSDALFMGQRQYSGLCKAASAVYQFENGAGSWKVTYTIEFKSVDEHNNTWLREEILNADTHYFKDIAGEKKLVSVRDGQDVLSGGIVLLDNNGFKIETTDSDGNRIDFTPTYTKYAMRFAADFKTVITTNAIDPYA